MVGWVRARACLQLCQECVVDCQLMKQRLVCLVGEVDVKLHVSVRSLRAMGEVVGYRGEMRLPLVHYLLVG